MSIRTINFKSFLREFGLLGLSALLFSFGALYNGYPLITGDSSIYISSGFTLDVPAERPIFYGLFLRFFSLGASLWLVIFTQGFILSWLFRRIVILCTKNSNAYFFLTFSFLLTIFTAATWENSKIMADIFICFYFLAAILFLFDKEQSPWRTTLYLLIIVWAGLSHYSHLLIMSLSLLGLIGLKYVVPILKELSIKKLLAMFGLSLFAWFTVAFSNYQAGNGFILSKSSHVFVMGKLSENGMLKTYLDDHCEEENFRICQFKDSLPITGWMFVWQPWSPVYHTGGWEANREEYKTIIKGTFTEPKYLWMHCYKSVLTTFVQLAQLEVGDAVFPMKEGSNTFDALHAHFPDEENAALYTKQRFGFIKFKMYTEWYLLTMMLSCLGLVWLVYRKQVSPLFLKILIILILMLWVNAFAGGNLANISSRLNMRMMWLLPAFNLLVLFDFFARKMAEKEDVKSLD